MSVSLELLLLAPQIPSLLLMIKGREEMTDFKTGVVQNLPSEPQCAVVLEGLLWLNSRLSAWVFAGRVSQGSPGFRNPLAFWGPSGEFVINLPS
jgi:hypothetical protein